MLNDKDRINIYKCICEIQERQIKFLKKDLSIYRDKYKKLRDKYNYEIRKNRVKN